MNKGFVVLPLGAVIRAIASLILALGVASGIAVWVLS